MRGVYAQTVTIFSQRSGSSPHARGLPGGFDGLAGGLRIIPACAGFTGTRPGRGSRRSDHPRMRGVYLLPRLKEAATAGSSPHARGLRTGAAPAATGSLDHPRMRGVYSPPCGRASKASGSSPHARGLPRARRQEPRRPRIIPACAGFTLGDPWNPNGPGVYHPPVSFTADLVPARRSCGSAAVEPRWTRTPWAA